MAMMELKPIGIIHTDFHQAAGTPIQPSKGIGVRGWIEVDEKYEAGLKDIDGFERIWLLFWCDRAGKTEMEVKPYMDTVKRGLFSTRAPSRPNPIGLSCVKLVSVEGNRLNIEDLDILDGSPLLDIKPYVEKFDNFQVDRCGWTDNTADENVKTDNRFFNDQNTG